LVVTEVRARAHLEPALDAGCRDLNVVFLGLHEAHLAGRHEQHTVGQPKPLKEDLGSGRHPLQRRIGLGRLLEQDHLDLVELMHAQDSPCVLARRASLASEAGRIGGVPDWQFRRVQDLVAMQVRDWHLGGLLARQLLPPLANRDICLFTTDWDIGVGRIGYAEERFLELPFHGRQFGVYGIDPPAQLGRGGPQLRNLPITGLGPSSDRLTDAFRCKVAFRLQPVAFVGQLAPADVELDGAVHDGGVLALVDRALADSIVVFAEALRADAHGSRPSRTAASSASGGRQPAASRSRRSTNSGLRLANSQPARGPFGRPRRAKYSAPNALPCGIAASLATEKMSACHASPLAGCSSSARSASAPRYSRWSFPRAATSRGNPSWTASLAFSGA